MRVYTACSFQKFTNTTLLTVASSVTLCAPSCSLQGGVKHNCSEDGILDVSSIRPKFCEEIERFFEFYRVFQKKYNPKMI